MVAFSLARGLISAEDADAWLAALADAQQADKFFFSSTPVVTLATAVMP